jgi:excisionase family DNA binding protein
MLTPKEAAAVLNLCRNTLETMVDKGILREGYHYYQHGDTRRFHPALADRLLDAPPTAPTTWENIAKDSRQRKRTKKPKSRPRKEAAKSAINENY